MVIIGFDPSPHVYIIIYTFIYIHIPFIIHTGRGILDISWFITTSNHIYRLETSINSTVNHVNFASTWLSDDLAPRISTGTDPTDYTKTTAFLDCK